MENLPRSGLAAPGEVCFSFLERGGEFESSRLLKTAKTAHFASLVRYFYFTPPNFSILSQLFLFSSKPCSLCTKIPHQSAGFLLASRLSTKLGPSGETQTRGLAVPNRAFYQLNYTRILKFFVLPVCGQSYGQGGIFGAVLPLVRIRQTLLFQGLPGFAHSHCGWPRPRSQSRRATNCATPRYNSKDSPAALPRKGPEQTRSSPPILQHFLPKVKSVL